MQEPISLPTEQVIRDRRAKAMADGKARLRTGRRFHASNRSQAPHPMWLLPFGNPQSAQQIWMGSRQSHSVSRGSGTRRPLFTRVYAVTDGTMINLDFDLQARTHSTVKGTHGRNACSCERAYQRRRLNSQPHSSTSKSVLQFLDTIYIVCRFDAKRKSSGQVEGEVRHGRRNAHIRERRRSPEGALDRARKDCPERPV